MKPILVLLVGLVSVFTSAQSQSLPKNWEGEWKGELNWYKTGT